MRPTVYPLILAVLLLAITGQCLALAQQQVMIVQSSPLEAYQRAIVAFKQGLNAATSQPGARPLHICQSVLLDPAAAIQGNTHRVTKKYQEQQPDMVVAVGGLALETAKDLQRPIIYLMTPAPDGIAGKRPNITGIKMPTAPEVQLSALKRTFPSVKTIGLLHNPASSGDFVSLAQAAARKLGLTIIEAPAGNSRRALQIMDETSNLIDAIWLTPDPSIISQTMLDALALVSLEKRIPLVAFAPKYLEQGAAMTIFTSPEGLGRQAAAMAIKLGSTPPVDPIEPEYGHEATTLTNGRIILKLGLTVAPPSTAEEVKSP